MSSPRPAAEPLDSLWCDGACSGNPGPGGWAALLRRKVTLAAPAAGVSGAGVVRHYVGQAEGLEARGLIVAGGRWRAALDANAAALGKDPALPVRVTVDRELSGGEAATTNNRMEQSALLFGLRALARPVAVSVHLDSNYVMQAFSKGWLAGWQRNGWVKSDKKPVLNRDLWEQLAVEVDRHQITWVKVKGHAGVALNERVDALAVAARDRARR